MDLTSLGVEKSKILPHVNILLEERRSLPHVRSAVWSLPTASYGL